jgi:hypothetical protein
VSPFFRDTLKPNLMLASRDLDVMIRTSPINPIKDFSRFAEACKLEQVHIVCEEVWLLDLIEKAIFPHLTTLHKVELSFSWCEYSLSAAGMDALDARFGVRGYHATVGSTIDTTLFWEAPKGQVLKFLEPTGPLQAMCIWQPVYTMF